VVEKMIYAHTLKEPKQWRAFESNGKSFYYDCCKCGAKEPIIKGFLSTKEKPDLLDLIIRPRRDGTFNLALYCTKCWDKLERG